MKREWVAALRSGEYRQARESLCTLDGAMCCLGVLIDISQDGYWDLGYGRYAYGGNGGTLSQQTRQELGLTDDEVDALVARNDGLGYRKQNFRQIANYIEANL